jgi:hypothetical protein
VTIADWVDGGHFGYNYQFGRVVVGNEVTAIVSQPSDSTDERHAHAASRSAGGDMATTKQNQFDPARGVVDDAFRELQEKHLKLASPNYSFRQDVLDAIAWHSCVPPDGLASVSRESLRDDKKYWDKIHTASDDASWATLVARSHRRPQSLLPLPQPL